MQKSLQFVLIQEIGETPYWRATFSEITEDGNSRQFSMPIQLGTEYDSIFEAVANEIKNYQPEAPPDALSQAKARKLAQINASWNQQLKTGWNSGQGRLGLTAEDVALISGAYSLAKEASTLGLPLPSLVTLENTVIEFASLGDMTQMMLMYGAARSQLSIQYASKRKAVNDATTIDEVNEV